METKDWILLIVPIILDSLIFYFIHLYFENKLKIKNEYQQKQRKLERKIYKYCNSSISDLDNLIETFDNKEFKEIGLQIAKVVENVETMKKLIIDNIELKDFISYLNIIIWELNLAEKEICKLASNQTEEARQESMKLLNAELYILMRSMDEMRKLCMQQN